MSIERVYSENEIEGIRLKLFTEFVNNAFREKGNYDDYMVIRTTYFDVGMDWLYSALIQCELKNGMGSTITSYQAFCPRDYKLIVLCDSISKLKEMAEYYVSLKTERKWNYKTSLYEKFE